MLGSALLHQGRKASLPGFAQKVKYAESWGATKPTAIAEPPMMSASRRLMLVNVGGEDVTSTASATTKGIPLNKPLLRNAQDKPNHSPDEIKLASWARWRCLESSRPLERKRYPRNDKRVNVLSAYGAERKRPAGETMCRSDATKDKLLFFVTVKPS